MGTVPTPAHTAHPPVARTGDPELELAALLVETAVAQLSSARRRLHRALEERARRGGRQPGMCGTPAGYRRHLRAQETPCVPCVEAHRWDAYHRSQRNRRAA